MTVWCVKCGATDPPRQFDGYNGSKQRGHYLGGGPPADCGPLRVPPRDDLGPPGGSASWLDEMCLRDDPHSLIRENMISSDPWWTGYVCAEDVVVSASRALERAKALRAAALVLYHHYDCEPKQRTREFEAALTRLLDTVQDDAPDCPACGLAEHEVKL